MKKSSKSKSSAPKVDPYLEGLMAKLLDRLTSLERKLDTVVSQTAGRPSGNGQAPKPFQPPQVQQPPRRDRVLYEAICADCHKVCEVPFRPTEDRAVYCKECFAKRKAGVPKANPYLPVMTPVAMPQKPFKKPAMPQPVSAPVTAGKAKKSLTAKKSKKKK